MANIETLLADTRYFVDQGSDPSAPSAGNRILYTKAGGIYLRSSAAIVGPLLDEAAHDALDHTGLTGVGGGGSSAFVGCVAQRTTDQTLIPTVTATAVSLTGTDVIDTDGYHDPASNPSRITIPTGKDGKYRFACFIPWDTNNTGYRQVFFRKNGAGYYVIQQYAAAVGGVNTYQTFTAPPIGLVATDYMEVWVEHNSGGDRSLIGGTFPILFSAEFLGT